MNHRTKLFAAALLALATSAMAGNPAPESASHDVQPQAVVKLSELQKTDDALLLNGTPFTGSVVDYYPNGTRKTRFQVLDGKIDGAWAEWHPDGAIRFYSEWRAGKGEGPFVYFHTNGEISERVTARADIWNGVAEGWHPDGSKAFERFYQAGTALYDRRFPAARSPKSTLFLPDVLGPAGRITLTPGFSPDGGTMYFAQTECAPIWECPQRLKRIMRTESGWSRPARVPLPQDARVDYPSVTPDGRYLLFSWSATRPDYAGRDIYENFDLWRLDLTDTSANPEPLDGPDLNRIREGAVKKLRFVNNETAPILTTDGDLYFWTERLDGMGDRDVYRARPDGEGGFQRPEILTAPINSRSGDDGAWISPDGRTMLITYYDRGGCGGSDLFIAHRNGENWTNPANLGCDINSPFDEYAASMIPGTRKIVFPSTRPFEGAARDTVALWVAELPIASN